MSFPVKNAFSVLRNQEQYAVLFKNHLRPLQMVVASRNKPSALPNVEHLSGSSGSGPSVYFALLDVPFFG
ncbi:hypothetical protein L596_019292 [Steinernema carpocapsae]|uniref:Uncharacterized protein n=1 Tax=Steinernema carpocapsae TaxID=34508 RepID=A0A4U5MR02_STECR|nr:hypothetical protein L596_019292 [Steinernema carpocapsae]